MIYECDNGQMDRGNENPTQHLPWWLRKTTKKTQVRLVGTGIWTRDLPNASLMRYHGASSLGKNFSTLKFTGVGWVWTRDP